MLIRRIISNFSFSFGKMFFAQLSNIFIARLLLDPAEFGVLNLAISYVGVLFVILSLGISSSLVRYSKEQFRVNNLENYIAECYSIIFFLQLLIISVFVLFKGYFTSLFFSGDNYSFLIYYVSFSIMTQTIQTWISSIYWGFNNFKYKGITITIFPFLKFLIFGLCYIYFERLSLINVVFIIILSEFISVGFNLILFKKKFDYIPFKFFQLPSSFSYNIKKSFSYGIWSMLAAVGMLSMTLIDKVFISRYVNNEDLGRYTVLVSLVSLLTLVLVSVSNVLLSSYLKLWNLDKIKVIKKINQIFYISLILIFFSGLIFSLLADSIISLVYGSIYNGLSYIIPVMLLSVLFNANYIIMGNLAAISEKPKFTTYAFIFGLFINITGNYFFTPRYGIEAVVIVTAVSYFFIALVMNYFLKKHISEYSLLPFLLTIISSILIYTLC